MVNINNEECWKRPFTTKLYLHPPFAEQIVTMWPDMRIMISEVNEPGTQHLPSAAFRFLIGDDLKEVDYKKANYEVREDGIPVHAFSHDMGDYTIRMESFCNVKRVPVVFTKISYISKVP